jgi:hypothetical protein
MADNAAATASSAAAPAAAQTSSAPAPSTSTPATGNNLGTGTDVGAHSSAPSNAPVTPDAKAPVDAKPASAPKSWKLKVDGGEQELPEYEVLRRAQLWSAQDKRFQEAAQIKKQHEQITGLLKEKPIEALMKLHGPEKVREMLERHLYEQLQADQLSPEQKRLRQAEEELKSYKQREAEAAKQREVEQRKQIETHYKGEYERQILESLKTSGLPADEDTVARMAFYMQQSLREGIEVPMDVIADRVKADFSSRTQRRYAKMDGDQLLKELGDETVDKIVKAHLARAKAAQPTVPSRPPETPINGAEQSKPQKRYKTMDEARAEIEKRLNS